MKKLLTILLLTITANTLFAQRKYVIKSNGYSNTQINDSLNKKLNISDTASMLSPYARTADIPSVTGKLNISDTASMLSPFLRKADSTIANRVTVNTNSIATINSLIQKVNTYSDMTPLAMGSNPIVFIVKSDTVANGGKGSIYLWDGSQLTQLLNY